MTRSHAALLVATLAVLAAPSARADDEPAAEDPAQEARQQYQAGMQAYQARRFVEAALHFEAAVLQRPHAVALYTAGLAWEQANRPERAADDFSRALDVTASGDPKRGGPGLSAAQAQNARDRLTTLEKTMGTLEVTAPEGWRVQLDANTQAPTPARLHAMPGVHGLSAQPPSGAIERQDVSLELGKTARVELAEAPKPEPAPPPPPVVAPPEPIAPPPPPPKPDLRPLVGVGVFGAGVATVLGGVVLGVNAASARDAYNATPSQATYDHASSLQTWTNVTLVTGGLLVAGGAAIFFWPRPKAQVEPAVSLVPAVGGAALRGSF